ncbi:hypothetical protein AN1V17_12970 [Vallitalea sediminicola]
MTPTAPLGNIDIKSIPKDIDTNMTPINLVRKHISFTIHYLLLHYMFNIPI